MRHRAAIGDADESFCLADWTPPLAWPGLLETLAWRLFRDRLVNEVRGPYHTTEG